MSKKNASAGPKRGTLTKNRRQQVLMVRPEGDDAVNEALRKMRVTKVAGLSVLYLWFSKQTPATQQLVMGLLPDKYADDAAKDFVEWTREHYSAFRADAEDLLLS